MPSKITYRLAVCFLSLSSAFRDSPTLARTHTRLRTHAQHTQRSGRSRFKHYNICKPIFLQTGSHRWRSVRLWPPSTTWSFRRNSVISSVTCSFHLAFHLTFNTRPTSDLWRANFWSNIFFDWLMMDWFRSFVIMHCVCGHLNPL